MPKSEHFNIGFMITQGENEHLFLSVAPGFEHGPGIQRDGISSPRMTDPHAVEAVTNSFGIDGDPWRSFPATTDPFVQRAGTWTLYHHLKDFHNRYGKEWRIVGVQSNGDLTMNFWHVAYINKPGNKNGYNLCGLRTQGDMQEPIAQRSYRCLVKWRNEAATARNVVYEYLNVRFSPFPDERWMIKPSDHRIVQLFDTCFKNLEGYNSHLHDIGPLLEFALSGKIIVEDGSEISLANTIDRFEDVRHVFNLPTVKAVGHFDGHDVKEINFGEYQLFANVNERRAALSSPVVIDLKISKNVTTTWSKVRETLLKRHYREVSESPTRRGQFRQYSDRAVEVFFPHNVYPFGVLGIRPSEQNTEHGKELVGLSSGGLSGRVGNTLEGISQIMFDFFGCTDAMVLDEGYDVFSLTNPKDGNSYRYSNSELLSRVLSFTKWRVDKDAKEALEKSKDYTLGNEMKIWPLNSKYMSELEEDFKKIGAVDYADVIIVSPHRSQMRSVLIFAVKETV